MLLAFREGLRAAWGAWRLVLLVWLANSTLALGLALPLALKLEHDLAERGAAARMRDGFDYAWWERWQEQQQGQWSAAFGPEMEGAGFAWRNLDLLLRGHFPARLFEHGEDGAARALDPLVLGLGLGGLLLNVYLAGGVLSALRTPGRRLPLRGLLHAAGFYCGRMARLAVAVALCYALVFALHAPFARWVDYQAREALSGQAALAWTLGRRLLLLLALGAVFVWASCAKALVVLEERASVLLALASAAGHCLRRARAFFGQALLLGLTAVAVLALWSAWDARWETRGYASQVPALVAMQLFVIVRTGLRLALYGGQLALLRAAEQNAPQGV